MMSDNKIIITLSKKSCIAGIALFSLVLVLLYLLPDSNRSYCYAIFLTPVLLIIIVYECLELGTSYVFDESGVSRLVFGRKQFSLSWDECVYIGVFRSYSSDATSKNGWRIFACAKTPLVQRSTRDARRREYSLQGNPQNRISPSWKRDEAIQIPYDRIGDANYARILKLSCREHISNNLTIDKASYTTCTMNLDGWTELKSDCQHKPKLALKDCVEYAFSKNGESIYKNRCCLKCGRMIDVKNDRRVNGNEAILSFIITILILILLLLPEFLVATWLERTGMALLLWAKIVFCILVGIAFLIFAFVGQKIAYALASYFVLKHSAEWTTAQSNAHEKE